MRHSLSRENSSKYLYLQVQNLLYTFQNAIKDLGIRSNHALVLLQRATNGEVEWFAVDICHFATSLGHEQ